MRSSSRGVWSSSSRRRFTIEQPLNKTTGGGLLQNSFLTSASGFEALTEECVKEAEALAERARTMEIGLDLVKVMDELSNTICVVSDMVGRTNKKKTGQKKEK